MSQEPLYFRPYAPGRVILRTPVFVTMCILSAIGAFTLLLIVLGV